MDFQFSAEDEAFRGEVRAFIDQHYTADMRARASVSIEIRTRFSSGVGRRLHAPIRHAATATSTTARPRTCRIARAR